MNILKVDTSTRLKQIMNERNLKQSEPYQKELDIKMGKSTLSQYVNGVQSPDQDRIYLLSKTLNVSEPWLMGFDVAKDRVPDGKRTETKERKDILSIYNQLAPPRQEKVYNFAERQPIILRSINDLYEDRVVSPEQIRIIGKVIF